MGVRKWTKIMTLTCSGGSDGEVMDASLHI